MGGKNLKIDRLELKNRIKKSLHRIRQIKTWQLFIILLLLVFIDATMLRFNHLKMVELKTAVETADEAGDEAAITEALDNLRNYVNTHTVINVVEKNGESVVTFGTGPVYLEHQYVRKASAALAAAEANAATDENPNGNVFAKAMGVCRPLALANGWVSESPEYINCFMSEIAKYPTSDSIETSYSATLPSTGLFRYDFASPVWTFSLPGILSIICIILAAILLVRVFVWCALHLALLFVKV